jgi:hypothetical protein
MDEGTQIHFHFRRPERGLGAGYGLVATFGARAKLGDAAACAAKSLFLDGESEFFRDVG